MVGLLVTLSSWRLAPAEEAAVASKPRREVGAGGHL